jgi:hypothetical protein
MREYTVMVLDGDSVIHHARCTAKSPEMAKSKCLSDCWKLDKVMGFDRPWHKYSWEVVEGAQVVKKSKKTHK